MKLLAASGRGIIKCNKNLLSLALRQKGGDLLVSTGDHINRWEEMTGEYSKDSQVRVPIGPASKNGDNGSFVLNPQKRGGMWFTENANVSNGTIYGAGQLYYLF